MSSMCMKCGRSCWSTFWLKLATRLCTSVMNSLPSTALEFRSASGPAVSCVCSALSMVLIAACAVSLPWKASEISPDSDGPVNASVAAASNRRSSRCSSNKTRPRAPRLLCSLSFECSSFTWLVVGSFPVSALDAVPINTKMRAIVFAWRAYSRCPHSTRIHPPL